MKVMKKKKKTGFPVCNDATRSIPACWLCIQKAHVGLSYRILILKEAPVLSVGIS